MANKKQEWEKVLIVLWQASLQKVYCTIEGKVGMIGVVVMPAALSHLLNIPMIEFTDHRIDLPLIFGSQAHALTDQINVALTHGERIKIIEQFLIKLLHKRNTQTDIVDYALNSIIRQNGILSIEKLSDELCMSLRHFRRRFTEKVGISPKFYARVKRVNYLTQLTQTSTLAWADIIYRAGYYDQAHFIHDLYNFSGRKPAEFIHYNQHLAQLVNT
jgi:AraC-like DNA-binding protein